MQSFNTNLRTASANSECTRRISPLRKQHAIHLIDTSEQQQQQQTNFNQMNINNLLPIQQQQQHQMSSVKTQRNNNLGLFQNQTKLHQAKSFTMLQQSSSSDQNNQMYGQTTTKWNSWRDNRSTISSGLFRCKSACETNTSSSALNRNEEEATIESRTG